MPYNHIWLQEAQAEYEAAVEWYLENSINAASKLVEEVNRTLTLICDNPQRGRQGTNIFKNFI